MTDEVPTMALTPRGLRAVLDLLDEIYAAMAVDVFPGGGGLLCLECRGARTFTVQDVAAYLDTGWPTCCGRPMRVRAGHAPVGGYNPPPDHAQRPETPTPPPPEKRIRESRGVGRRPPALPREPSTRSQRPPERTPAPRTRTGADVSESADVSPARKPGGTPAVGSGGGL